MRRVEELLRILSCIDGRGYKTYKDIQGSYGFPAFTLYIDHVQGDPFASPSKVCGRVPQATTSLSSPLFASATGRLVLEDYLARKVSETRIFFDLV